MYLVLTSFVEVDIPVLLSVPIPDMVCAGYARFLLLPVRVTLPQEKLPMNGAVVTPTVIPAPVG